MSSILPGEQMGARSERQTESLGVDYARYSTDRQSSTADQHRVNDALAAEYGVLLVKRFQDEATSRSLKDREGLQALLQYLRTHRDVRWIVVNELERLTGDLEQRAELKSLCRELEVTLLTEDGPIDPFDDEGQHGADQKAVGAAGEVLKVRRRTRRSMKAKVQAGTVMMRPAFGTRMKPLLDATGQPLPTGTRLLGPDGKRVRSEAIEADPDELPWVLKMFEWVADEHCSLDQVARRLTAAGVNTKSGGTTWAGSSVRGILTNPFYRGEYVWGRQKTVHTATGTRLVTRAADDPERLVLDSPLGALVPVDLWHRANEVVAARAGERRHSRRRVNRARPFDGLVYCGRCGHKMYGRADERARKDGTRRDTWRYYCIAMRPGAQQLDGFGPPCRTSNALAESKIVAALAGLAADPTQPPVVVSYVAPATAEAQMAVYEKQLRDLEDRWQRTLEFGLRGILTADQVAARQADHEAESADLRARLSAPQEAAPQGTYVFEAAAALSGVIELLRGDTLPAEVLRAGLRDMGLVRVLADAPGLQIEWVR